MVTPITARASHCVWLGFCQKKAARLMDNTAPMALLMNNIRNGGSMLLNCLTNIASNPINSAASRAKMAAGWNASEPGRMRMIAPTRASNAADQRLGPTCSPSMMTDNPIVMMTLRKLMALASARGILIAAMNMQVIPSHPEALRAKCNRQGTLLKPGFLAINIGAISINAKQNRPAETWVGCKTVPGDPVPRVLAINEIAANKLTETSMKIILMVLAEKRLMPVVVLPRGDTIGSCQQITTIPITL